MRTRNCARADGCIQGVDGLRLRFASWEAPSTRAGMLIVHGHGEHGGRYRDLAEVLAKHRISSFALDLRGHGASDGRRGHTPDFACYLQDLDRFRREVACILEPGTPLFLLGHSMGGLIALRYVQEYDSGLAGAILLSPWLATAIPVPRWKVALAGTANRVLPALPFSTRIRPEMLTHDPAEARAWKEDRLVHTSITPRLFTGTAEAMGLVLRRADRIDLPLLVLFAGDDKIADSDRGVALVRALPQQFVEMQVLDGKFHELLHEYGRDEIMARIANWIDARLT